MYTLGLTGGIASGKSVVSAILQELGAFVIDADQVARDIVRPGEKAWLDIVNTFGRSILHDDGDIDRKKLGKVVFGNKEALNKLNNITHPEIIKQINDNIKELSIKHKDAVVFVEVPLLFETGMEKMMDEVWLVAIEHETQLKRLILRENLTVEEAEQRIKSQMPLEEKIAKADKVINNSRSIDNTREFVLGLWKGLMEQLKQE